MYTYFPFYNYYQIFSLLFGYNFLNIDGRNVRLVEVEKIMHVAKYKSDLDV